MHSTAIQYRFFRPVYDSPQRSKIFGAVKIGVYFESAVSAFESLTSPLTYRMALRTSLGRVGRVYNNSALNRTPYFYSFCPVFIDPFTLMRGVIELDFIKAFFLPGYGADTVTNGVGLLQSLKQQLSLFIPKAQFYFQRQFHSLSSNDVITFVRGSTVQLTMNIPSYATKLFGPNITYLRTEKYFDIFF